MTFQHVCVGAMQVAMFVLAEISDKMPGAFWTVSLSLPFAFIAMYLCALRWYLVLLFVPLIGYGNFILWAELNEPVFGGCIVIEMGYGYIWSEFIGWNMPFIVAIVVAALIRNRGQKEVASRLHSV